MYDKNFPLSNCSVSLFKYNDTPAPLIKLITGHGTNVIYILASLDWIFRTIINGFVGVSSSVLFLNLGTTVLYNGADFVPPIVKNEFPNILLNAFITVRELIMLTLK